MDPPQRKDYFALLPKEIIRYLLPDLNPSAKNALRLTNKYFSHELSRETIQDFMICNDLHASDCDFARIIIQTICDHEGVFVSTDKKLEVIKNSKLEFITYVSQHKLKGKCFYSIPGKSERIEWIFPDNPQDAFRIVCINNNKKIEAINPFITACIIGDSVAVETTFKNISEKLSDYNFELGVHILIQNNDIKSLYNLLKDKENRKKMCPMSPRLLEWTLFNGSDKVIHLINNSYKKCLTQASMDGTSASLQKNMDYYCLFFKKNNPIKEGGCFELTKHYYQDLIDINKNDLSRSYRCLNILVGEKKEELLKFSSPIPVIDKKELKTLKSFKCLNEKEKKDNKSRRIIPCLIM